MHVPFTGPGNAMLPNRLPRETASAAALALLLCACAPPEPSLDTVAQGVSSLVLAGPASADSSDPRWTAVRRVFGQEGEAEDGYFRVNLPRSDLRVRIGDVVLEPGFDLTTYFAFVPRAGGRVMAMGEVILRQDEAAAAVEEAHRRRVEVTALHNHLLGETPRIMYMHVMAEGLADTVAARLRAIVARTATPLARAGEEKATVGWAETDSVLGPHTEAEGRVAEYVFPRREDHAIHGVPVRSSGVLETASEVVFQRLGGGRTASTGELYLDPSEVQAVVGALAENGLLVTAVHNHMLDESPPMFWVHWYATGDGDSLARRVAAVLAHTNSARMPSRESKPE